MTASANKVKLIDLIQFAKRQPSTTIKIVTDSPCVKEVYILGFIIIVICVYILPSCYFTFLSNFTLHRKLLKHSWNKTKQGIYSHYFYHIFIRLLLKLSAVSYLFLCCWGFFSLLFVDIPMASRLAYFILLLSYFIHLLSFHLMSAITHFPFGMIKNVSRLILNT